MKKLYFLFFGILFSIVSYGQEILTNGDLESWTDATTPAAYDKAESVLQESTIVHGGTYSLKIAATGTRDLTQNLTIEPGESYTISFWYYVESGDGDDARIWSYWLNGTSTVTDAATDNDLRGPGGNYLTSAASWQQYSVDVTAPSTGVDGLRLEVRTYSGSTVYWDDISVIDNNTLSSKTNEIENFNIYPNPTNLGYVDISSKRNSPLSITIFDVLGKQVLNTTLSTNKLDISSLPAGIYIVKAIQNEALSTKKLVIR